MAGALAQHAEATLERIGTHRAPLVRELFRNLVTAQGTRAVREREELLSVFPEENRAEADEVLGALVDARLLTSFEKAGEEAGESRQEIEIIHESLLSRWPRLVRWQTQDADGAQLRDQLRQAAQAWQDRGQPEDLLWSGTAYRDFAVWKERYSGGLSATEEAFASAAESARGAPAPATTVGGGGGGHGGGGRGGDDVRALARRPMPRRAAPRRPASSPSAASSSIDYPTAALAYIRKSLELADSAEARRLAVEALWRGPPGPHPAGWPDRRGAGHGRGPGPHQPSGLQPRRSLGGHPGAALPSGSRLSPGWWPGACPASLVRPQRQRARVRSAGRPARHGRGRRDPEALVAPRPAPAPHPGAGWVRHRGVGPGRDHRHRHGHDRRGGRGPGPAVAAPRRRTGGPREVGGAAWAVQPGRERRLARAWPRPERHRRSARARPGAREGPGRASPRAPGRQLRRHGRPSGLGGQGGGDPGLVARGGRPRPPAGPGREDARRGPGLRARSVGCPSRRGLEGQLRHPLGPRPAWLRRPGHSAAARHALLLFRQLRSCRSLARHGQRRRPLLLAPRGALGGGAPRPARGHLLHDVHAGQPVARPLLEQAPAEPVAPRFRRRGDPHAPSRGAVLVGFRSPRRDARRRRDHDEEDRHGPNRGRAADSPSRGRIRETRPAWRRSGTRGTGSS